MRQKGTEGALHTLTLPVDGKTTKILSPKPGACIQRHFQEVTWAQKCGLESVPLSIMGEEVRDSNTVLEHVMRQLARGIAMNTGK